MKLISFLSIAALLGVGLSFFDFSFRAESLGIYAATASILFLLGAVRDYTPRRPYWQARHPSITHFPAAPARTAERFAA